MLYQKVLHKAFSKIPDMTAEEVDLAVDSVIHVKELSLMNATKNMATKDDIKDIESRMATKDDIKDIESKMATKDDIKDMATKSDIKESKMATQNELSKMENRLTTRVFGFFVAAVVIVLAGVSLIIRFSPPPS